MNIGFDKEKLILKIQVTDDQDMTDANRIKTLSESKDYKLLLNAYANVREQILEGIKYVTATESNARMAAIKAAVLKGFDMAIGINYMILESAEKFRQDNLDKLEENKNEHGSDDE